LSQDEKGRRRKWKGIKLTRLCFKQFRFNNTPTWTHGPLNRSHDFYDFHVKTSRLGSSNIIRVFRFNILGLHMWLDTTSSCTTWYVFECLV
jgi:hypothetical protein